MSTTVTQILHTGTHSTALGALCIRPEDLQVAASSCIAERTSGCCRLRYTSSGSRSIGSALMRPDIIEATRVSTRTVLCMLEALCTVVSQSIYVFAAVADYVGSYQRVLYDEL
jgi:hypothetical protein